jgi:MADS-box transcription factor
MKKAWELSVLCAADVSIIIFSANGKPYEFSSKELDEEINRYQDVSGMSPVDVNSIDVSIVRRPD